MERITIYYLFHVPRSMQLHQIKPKHKLKKKKRVGRGGKRGTYSGKGIKGQKSRAGKKMQPVIRELIKKYPKLRGYRFKKREKNILSVNIYDLDKRFKEGEVVSSKALLEKKLIRRIKGKTPRVKILDRGELTKNLIIEGCEVSKGAKRTIEKAGGRIKNSKSQITNSKSQTNSKS